MLNLSLEQFYDKIKKKIALISAYTGNKYASQIITSCRLKPESIFDRRRLSAKLEFIWLDEFGNRLEISDKKLYVKIAKQQITATSTDIHRNQTIDFLIKRSTLAYIKIYPENDTFSLLLKGTDNYFRCFNYNNNQFVVCSPLTFGLKALQLCCSERQHVEFDPSNTYAIIQLPATKLPQQITNKIIRNLFLHEHN